MSPKPIPCPICRRPASADTRPFCSSACRDRDLLQWLGEGYRVPGAAAQNEENGDGFGVDSTRD
ncbi:MAG: DNA gyrase inhibitor YacG [Sphingobium sp.]